MHIPTCIHVHVHIPTYLYKETNPIQDAVSIHNDMEDARIVDWKVLTFIAISAAIQSSCNNRHNVVSSYPYTHTPHLLLVYCYFLQGSDCLWQAAIYELGD